MGLLCEPARRRYRVEAMFRWSRIRQFLAVSADVIGVAIGVGFIVTALAGVWNEASLHLRQPWLTLVLIGVFLLVAGLAGRAMRYLPQPAGNSVEKPDPTLKSTERNESDAGKIEADLLRLAKERLDDVPLRPYETQIVIHILRDAIQSLDQLPFNSMQPGNDATDVQFTGQRRRCSDSEAGEQMWHLPTTFKGLGGGGIILSDQTFDTLTDLHRRLMKLRREVYDRYHQPTLPGAPSSTH